MEPYQPEPLPIQDLDVGELISLVGDANAALAGYNGTLKGMVNPAVLLSPLTNQEAVLSSRIEGTVATLEEVLEHEAGQPYDEPKERDIGEILNYRRALRQGEDYLAERPVTLGLVRQLHSVLMSSVRGRDKKPGEFRTEQNYIAPAATPSSVKATFVPPQPAKLQDALEEWERYVRGSDIDPLIQTAVMHAQFELIHPFMDGNGRIGRLLIPLFLTTTGRLQRPMFYLSSYLEAHRESYYDALQRLSSERDWTGWVAFFLQAIITQANDNIEKSEQILNLYENMKDQIRGATHSQYAQLALDGLFAQPIFNPHHFITNSGLTKPTAHTIIRRLREAGIIVTIREGRGQRPSILAFPALLKLAEGDTVA